MPAGMGEEERFAAAVEHGTTPASHGRGTDSANSLAHELEIVALLRSGGSALGPEPAARNRAKQRLMAAFAQEFGHGADAGNATEATGPLQVLAPVALAERPPARHAEPTPPQRSAERAPHRAGRHSAPEPEPVEEPETDDAPELGNVRRLGSSRAAQRRGHGRAAVLGAAAAAALVAIAGTGTFASRDALPGDSMYGVKRVAESTSYALTFGEQAKARRHLEQAQRRLDEVEGMVDRSRTAQASGSASGSGTTSASASADPEDQELLRSTMQEFDSDTSEGSRLLLAGPTPPDTAQVDEVRTWATEQSERLSDLRSTLPAPDRADESLALLNRVLGETDALAGAACQPTEAGDATTAAAVDACGSSESSSEPGLTRTEDVPTPDGDARARARSSATAGTDDDEVDGDADTSADVSTDGDGGSARSSTSGSGSAGTDDRPRRDDSSGSSGGSGASGGSDDLPVPLPLPAKIGVPSVGPLPGVSLGG